MITIVDQFILDQAITDHEHDKNPGYFILDQEIMDHEHDNNPGSRQQSWIT